MTKTAIVTGATRGIGRASAIALARLGYDVVITGRTQQEGDAAKRPEAQALPELRTVTGSLASTAAAIEAEGRRAIPLVLDLLDRDALRPVAEEAIAALGHVDILVNNAIYVGPAGEKRFLETPADELEKRLFGNITAQLLFTQPVLAHMVERRSGVIANVTSGAGYNKPFAAIGQGGWARPALRQPHRAQRRVQRPRQRARPAQRRARRTRPRVRHRQAIPSGRARRGR